MNEVSACCCSTLTRPTRIAAFFQNAVAKTVTALPPTSSAGGNRSEG
jgi:hypothetical protein